MPILESAKLYPPDPVHGVDRAATPYEPRARWRIDAVIQRSHRLRLQTRPYVWERIPVTRHKHSISAVVKRASFDIQNVDCNTLANAEH